MSILLRREVGSKIFHGRSYPVTDYLMKEHGSNKYSYIKGLHLGQPERITYYVDLQTAKQAFEADAPRLRIVK